MSRETAQFRELNKLRGFVDTRGICATSFLFVHSQDCLDDPLRTGGSCKISRHPVLHVDRIDKDPGKQAVPTRDDPVLEDVDPDTRRAVVALFDLQQTPPLTRRRVGESTALRPPSILDGVPVVRCCTVHCTGRVVRGCPASLSVYVKLYEACLPLVVVVRGVVRPPGYP
jgi:hypothetical protein